MTQAKGKAKDPAVFNRVVNDLKVHPLAGNGRVDDELKQASARYEAARKAFRKIFT